MLDVDGLILISVDDHIIEPPDLFVHHLDAKYLDRAPKLVRNDEGSDVWTSARWSWRRRRSTPWPVGPRRSTASSRRASTRSGPAATT